MNHKTTRHRTGNCTNSLTPYVRTMNRFLQQQKKIRNGDCAIKIKFENVSSSIERSSGLRCNPCQDKTKENLECGLAQISWLFHDLGFSPIPINPRL